MNGVLGHMSMENSNVPGKVVAQKDMLALLERKLREATQLANNERRPSRVTIEKDGPAFAVVTTNGKPSN